MSRLFRVIALVMLSTLVIASLAAAAAKKPAPKAKPKPKPTNKATLGTTQLKGEYAEFGSTYTLGKSKPLNITVKSAEYTVRPIVMGSDLHYPAADEKFLVIHFNIHNPRPEETYLHSDCLKVTGVDEAGSNRESLYGLGVESNKAVLDMECKPAQKVDVYAAIPVSAKGVVPKVIIKGSDELVLRYDLRGKVKPLVAPFADPNDKTGLTALREVPGQIGTFYPTGSFDVRVDSFAMVESVPDTDLEEDQKAVVACFTVKNLSPTDAYLTYDTFEATLTAEEGDPLEWQGDLFYATKDKSVEMDLKPGQEVKVRQFYTMTAEDTPAKFVIRRTPDGRAYSFDVKL